MSKPPPQSELRAALEESRRRQVEIRRRMEWIHERRRELWKRMERAGVAPSPAARDEMQDPPPPHADGRHTP